MDDEALASFVAVTGASEAEAAQMLEATNGSLQEAVELFFAAGAGGGGGAAAAGAPAAGAPGEDDEALARRLQQEAYGAGGAPGGGTGPSGAGAAPGEEEEVRAPLPARTERLYGDEFLAQPRPRAGARGPAPPPPPDAFRGAAGAGGAALSSLFEPPRELLFAGGFEEAKDVAAEQGRWLLVNLQSTTEFASHRLNRDTWRDAGVRALLGAGFLLLQAYDIAEEGARLMAFYHVEELPALIVVDPATGAPMRRWSGYVSPDRLGEDLAPFLDTGPGDAGAARLAAGHKRKHLGPGSGSTTPVGARGADAAALAAPPPPPAGPAAEEVAAAAAARLPAEPAGGGGARVALRLPGGGRSVRRFPPGAPLRALRDWCLSLEAEAAAGRPFALAEAAPGAPPLDDLDATVAAAGLAGAALAMRWAD